MADSNVKFFVNLTQSEAWQLKMMRDKHFIDYLLVIPETKNLWNLVINIAQHPGMFSPNPLVLTHSHSHFVYQMLKHCYHITKSLRKRVNHRSLRELMSVPFCVARMIFKIFN